MADEVPPEAPPPGPGPLAEALRNMPLDPPKVDPPKSEPLARPTPKGVLSTTELIGSPTSRANGGRAWGVDWRSRAALFGVPVVHVAFGRDAQGRLRLAKGIIAVGQFGIGVITVAQFGVGLLGGVGQLILGTVTVAQFAIGSLLAIGQFAAGYIAVGQFVLGYYALGQAGWASALWSLTRHDPSAGAFFQRWVQWLNWTLQ